MIEPLPDHVFRNDSGRFIDVTAESGVADHDGRGLGVVATDLDGDARVDLFVANDSTANFLFRNMGGFRFEEVGASAGVAANGQGGYRSRHGRGLRRPRRRRTRRPGGYQFLRRVNNTLPQPGRRFFRRSQLGRGFAAPSRHRLGFGVAFIDANNDGWLDLLTANGHVSDRPLFPYAMTPQLFLGTTSGILVDGTPRSGPPFQRLYVGRGLAVGDLDNDGRPDAVMISQNEPLVYLHNESAMGEPRSHYLSVQVEGTRSNRDGVGATVTVTEPRRVQIAQRFGGGSFSPAATPGSISVWDQTTTPG